MKIYITLPHSALTPPYEQARKRIQQSLADRLLKYYGAFPYDCVEFFPNNTRLHVDVYVMDRPNFPGTEASVQDAVQSVIRETIPNAEVETRVNYQAFNPNFRPEDTPSKKTSELPSPSTSEGEKLSEFDYERLSMNYQAVEPHYTFDQVILSDATREQIEEAIGTIAVEKKVFDEWGLRKIIPHASSAMSFYGPPGTGKSMAAEAIAAKLGKMILRATYADIESKFHGEGPKMVKAIFKAAERDDAVLFIDESDSLLSKRLTNVSDGSAQAINSMRSQLLISLEQFKGIVIFATNLVVNYDKAFLSRLINIEFTVPDKEARMLIWKEHLMGDGIHIPLSSDIDLNDLAGKFTFCGREIKNSVKDACVTAAMHGYEQVGQDDLLKAAEKIRIESEKVLRSDDHTVSKQQITPEQAAAVKEALQNTLEASKAIKADELECKAYPKVDGAKG